MPSQSRTYDVDVFVLLAEPRRPRRFISLASLYDWARASRLRARRRSTSLFTVSLCSSCRLTTPWPRTPWRTARTLDYDGVAGQGRRSPTPGRAGVPGGRPEAPPAGLAAARNRRVSTGKRLRALLAAHGMTIEIDDEP